MVLTKKNKQPSTVTQKRTRNTRQEEVEYPPPTEEVEVNEAVEEDIPPAEEEEIGEEPIPEQNPEFPTEEGNMAANMARAMEAVTPRIPTNPGA